MQKYYLAVDIGASSGRHILGHMEGGKLVLEEMHRFPNGMNDINGTLCWDVEQLYAEIIAGMKKCKDAGKVPVSMGIDTWGVDFVLLDGEGNRIGNAVGYRDGRTKGADEFVYQFMPEDELYARTGIQKSVINTVYQLAAVKRDCPEELEKAEHLLMMPDYLHYLLTGKMAAEYTEASTSQLLNPYTKDWDYELLDRLGYPRKIFCEIQKPGTVLGNLSAEVQNAVGFDCEVVLPASHDTGSAVMAVPTNRDNIIYISSGTWSLMGCERMEPDCSTTSKLHNFTNEGGYDYRFRYLKNIMGLWMIQSVRKELAPEESFGTICENASKVTIASLVDCNDERFLAPANMTKEVQAACAESGQQVPEGIAEVASVIYNSLAKCYADTITELEEITGVAYDCIHVVGGGANAAYLNELTAKATGCTVYAGPTEATAIGNLTAQMITAGEMADLKSARQCIFESFDVKEYRA